MHHRGLQFFVPDARLFVSGCSHYFLSSWCHSDLVCKTMAKVTALAVRVHKGGDDGDEHADHDEHQENETGRGHGHDHDQDHYWGLLSYARSQSQSGWRRKA